MAQLGQELKHLRLEVVGVLHERHLVLNDETANGKTLINVDCSIRFVAEPDNKIFEEVHNLDAGDVIIVNPAVRLINS